MYKRTASSPAVNVGPTQASCTGQLRAMTRPECLTQLSAGSFGRLVVTTPVGQPLIRPVNYAFDERTQSVVFRNARGAKFAALLLNARAWFEIDAFDQTTGEGWSVIITGVTEQVMQAPEIARLERLELKTWAPGEHPHWVRIHARTVTGRRL